MKNHHYWLSRFDFLVPIIIFIFQYPLVNSVPLPEKNSRRLGIFVRNLVLSTTLSQKHFDILKFKIRIIYGLTKFSFRLVVHECQTILFYFISFFFFFWNILLLFNNFIHFLFCSILYFSFIFSKITFSIFSQEKSKTEYFSSKKTHGPWDWFVKPTMKPVFFIVSYDNGLLKTVIRECSWNKTQIENVETNLTFFMLAKLILGNKMRTAIEIISIEILIKQLKEIKVWIGITLL